MQPERYAFIIAMIMIIGILLGFAGLVSAAVEGTGKEKPGFGLANPASTYCIEQGGRLVIQKRGDGGEYGVCIFPDHRQCEEWALFRGECPPGGVLVTGCVTTAALYCAITGGQYSEVFNILTGKSEPGICSFKNGRKCDAQDYYNGKCSKDNQSSELKGAWHRFH